MTKRFGFTLAEVLITLGIIGVVAAMTIPTLISNTNGAKFRSQFKKTLSTLNQAGLMAQAQYDFDFAGTTAKCSDSVGGKTYAGHHPDSAMSFCAILNGTLTGQTLYPVLSGDNGIKRNNNGTAVNYELVLRDEIPENYTNYVAYTLADGSIVAFDPDAQGCELPVGQQLTGVVISGLGGEGVADLSSCGGFIDVNGATLPNKEVTCSDPTVITDSNVQTPCVVKNDANHMTDVFPVVFHDATVEPASNAAKYILTTSK